MLLLGIIMVPLSAGKEAAFYNITFMQALTFNFDGSSRGLLASYCVLLLGLALTLTAIVKSALTPMRPPLVNSQYEFINP